MLLRTKVCHHSEYNSALMDEIQAVNQDTQAHGNLESRCTRLVEAGGIWWRRGDIYFILEIQVGVEHPGFIPEAQRR